MPKQILSRIGFTQGVKPALDPAIIPPESLWKGFNISTDTNGILRIRKGYSSISPNLGFGCVQTLVNMFDGLFGIWKGRLYKFEPGYATPIGDELTTNYTASPDIVKWTAYGEPTAYIFSGNGLYKTDGTSVSLVEPYTPQDGEPSNLLTADADNDIAKCTTGIIRVSYSQRFAATCNPDSPNEVYLSAPFDASYFPADQVIKLPDDGGKIVGLAVWYNTLVIFRDKDIYMFYGSDMTDPEAMLVRQAPIGCVAKNTIVPVPEYGIIFLSTDGVYKLTGVVAIEDRVMPVRLSDDIEPILKDSMSAGLDGACAVYYDHEYRLSIPKHSVSTFRFDGTNWYTDTGQPFSAFAEVDNVLYAGNWFFGEVYKFDDVLYDNFVGYKFSAITKRDIFTTGEARITRMFVYLLHGITTGDIQQFFYADGYNESLYNASVYETIKVNKGDIQQLRISIIVDNTEYQVEDFTVTGKRVVAPNTNLSLPLQVYEKRFTPMLKGNSVQVKFESEDFGQDVAVLGYAIEYIPKTYMKGSVVSNGNE